MTFDNSDIVKLQEIWEYKQRLFLMCETIIQGDYDLSYIGSQLSLIINE